MCNLFFKMKEKEFTGYKIVVKKENGRYYSPAIGIEYTEGMTMPCINRKNALFGFFKNNFKSPMEILTGTTYRSDMQGRTSVFVHKDEAHLFYYYIVRHDNSDNHIIVKMTISEDLMDGEYHNFEVVAGRRIEKIEEL
ncbi:MAG: hypothetical protein ACOC22_01110 [bacterium]